MWGSYCRIVIVSYDLLDKIVRLIYNKNEYEGGDIMSITATELKNNLSKYLMLASSEDIYITRNGKVVAKLSNPYQERLDVAESLFGSVPATMTLEEAQEERLSKV